MYVYHYCLIQFVWYYCVSEGKLMHAYRFSVYPTIFCLVYSNQI